MSQAETHFFEFKHAALVQTRVPELLALNAAVVLERIARGGGATLWYLCSSVQALETIIERLSPGSVVSFYFDERITSADLTAQVVNTIGEIITVTTDAIVGTLDPDGVRINAELVVSHNDLETFVADITPDTRVFYGPFPGRDNDGSHAITLTIPDRDGVVRSHPH